MNYVIRLTYMDDKTLNLELPKDEVPKFLECLQKNVAYWAKDADVAFWTPNQQVRYTNINKIAEPAPIIEPKVEEVKTTEETDEV